MKSQTIRVISLKKYRFKSRFEKSSKYELRSRKLNFSTYVFFKIDKNSNSLSLYEK